MDYLLMLGVVVSNIIVTGLALVTVDYPPIYLARPIGLLNAYSCDTYDIRRLQRVTLEGLINFRKLPEEIRYDGRVILRMDLHNESNEAVNVRFRQQFYSLPCTFENHEDWFKYNCEYMIENDVLRFLVDIVMQPEHLDRIYSLHYQSNGYTISSEAKRIDYPVYVNNYGNCAGTIPMESKNDADSSGSHVSKYWHSDDSSCCHRHCQFEGISDFVTAGEEKRSLTSIELGEEAIEDCVDRAEE